MLARALENKILWSTFVQVFGKFFQIAVSLVTIKLITNALGIAEFGVYGKIAEYALFFSTVANLGIFGNAVRQMAVRPDDGKLFINAFLLRVGTAFAFFLSGSLYAFLFVEEKTFFIGTLFFMASLLFDYVSSISSAALQANYKMGRSVAALSLGRLVELGLVYLFTQSYHTADFYFLAPLGGSILSAGLTLFFVRQTMPFIWKLDTKMLWALFATSLPFGIINIINNLYFRFLPSYFASQILSTSDFGSYNLNVTATGSVAILSSFLMFSTLPALRESLKEGHMRRAKELYLTLRRGLFGLGICAIFFGSLLGPRLLALMSNESFLSPSLRFVLPMLLILAAVSYFYDLVLISLFALDNEIWYLKREIITLILAGSAMAIAYWFGTELGDLRVAFVLGAAIFGEGLMAFLGMRRLKTLLA